MLRFYAEKFCRISASFAFYGTIYGFDKDSHPSSLNPDHVAAIRGELATTGALCSELGLLLSATRAGRIIKGIDDDVPLSIVSAWLMDLNTCIQDELSLQVFLSLSQGKVPLWTDPLSEWENLQDSFPLCVGKVESAGRCLAVDLPDGCVFYLMSVAQDGIVALARHLKRKIDTNTDDWGKIITKVEAGVEAKRLSNPKRWKSIEPFYAEATSDLKAMKNAWRNPTLHFRRTYSVREAEKVYARVKDYMVHISKKLSAVKG